MLFGSRVRARAALRASSSAPLPRPLSRISLSVSVPCLLTAAALGCSGPDETASARAAAAYDNVAGESAPVPIPPGLGMRTTPGVGVDTVFLRARAAACVVFDGATGPALAEPRFFAETTVLGAARDVTTALAASPGVASAYAGVTSDARGVEFGLTRQPKIAAGAVEVLVKAWAQATDGGASGASASPHLTPAALAQWNVGPYDFALRCGTNWVSSRQLGSGAYLLYRFVPRAGVAAADVRAALAGKIDVKVDGGAPAVTLDLDAALALADLDFTMSTFGVPPQASPTLDAAGARDAAAVTAALRTSIGALAAARAAGPGSAEVDSLATMAIATTPYTALLAPRDVERLRTAFANRGFGDFVQQFLVPQMGPVDLAANALAARMDALADAIADADVASSAAAASGAAAGHEVGPEPSAAAWAAHLRDDWTAVRGELVGCRDGGSASDRYFPCAIPACDAQAAAVPYCAAESDLAAFRARFPR